MAAISISPPPPPLGNTQLMSRQGTPPLFEAGMSLPEALRKAEKRIHKEEDFYGWLLDQARMLRTLVMVGTQIDWADLAEELEGMARNEERSLRSQMERVLMLLLKWKFQPDMQSRSWKISIQNGRDEINDLLKTSPSLKSKLKELSDFAYRKARRTASDEMGCDEDDLPSSCPWDIDEFLDEDFFPHGCTI